MCSRSLARSLARRWEPLDRRQRLKILCRINGVLVVCAACFLVRVAVLSSALFVRSRHRCAVAWQTLGKPKLLGFRGIRKMEMIHCVAFVCSK